PRIRRRAPCERHRSDDAPRPSPMLDRRGVVPRFAKDLTKTSERIAKHPMPVIAELQAAGRTVAAGHCRWPQRSRRFDRKRRALVADACHASSVTAVAGGALT